jgi:hypothetical protein
MSNRRKEGCWSGGSDAQAAQIRAEAFSAIARLKAQRDAGAQGALKQTNVEARVVRKNVDVRPQGGAERIEAATGFRSSGRTQRQDAISKSSAYGAKGKTLSQSVCGAASLRSRRHDLPPY